MPIFCDTSESKRDQWSFFVTLVGRSVWRWVPALLTLAASGGSWWCLVFYMAQTFWVCITIIWLTPVMCVCFRPLLPSATTSFLSKENTPGVMTEPQGTAHVSLTPTGNCSCFSYTHRELFMFLLRPQGTVHVSLTPTGNCSCFSYTHRELFLFLLHPQGTVHVYLTPTGNCSCFSFARRELLMFLLRPQGTVHVYHTPTGNCSCFSDARRELLMCLLRPQGTVHVSLTPTVNCSCFSYAQRELLMFLLRPQGTVHVSLSPRGNCSRFSYNHRELFMFLLRLQGTAHVSLTLTSMVKRNGAHLDCIEVVVWSKTESYQWLYKNSFQGLSCYVGPSQLWVGEVVSLTSVFVRPHVFFLISLFPKIDVNGRYATKKQANCFDSKIICKHYVG